MGRPNTMVPLHDYDALYADTHHSWMECRNIAKTLGDDNPRNTYGAIETGPRAKMQAWINNEEQPMKELWSFISAQVNRDEQRAFISALNVATSDRRGLESRQNFRKHIGLIRTRLKFLEVAVKSPPTPRGYKRREEA